MVYDFAKAAERRAEMDRLLAAETALRKTETPQQTAARRAQEEAERAAAHAEELRLNNEHAAEKHGMTDNTPVAVKVSANMEAPAADGRA